VTGRVFRCRSLYKIPLIVHKGKETHDKLTVHAVSNTTVTWNRVAKILDVESTLEPRSKEASEWRDKGSECRQHQDVELNWTVVLIRLCMILLSDTILTPK